MPRDRTQVVRSQTRLLRASLGVLATGAAIALFPASAPAATIDELNARIADAQSQASQLGAQIEENAAALAQARSEAAAAAQREAELSSMLAEGEARERELEAEVVETQDALDRAKQRLSAARRELADRLVEIYKGSDPDALGLLLSADGFDDLATRVDLLQRIQQADEDLAARVESLKQEVDAKLIAVEDAEQQVSDYTDRLAVARDQIASVRAAAEEKAAAVASAQASQQASLTSLRDQVAGWESDVQAAREAAAARAAAAEQAAAEQAAAEAAATPEAAEQEVADWMGDWAIPESIVMCESGGNFGAVNPDSGAGGAYQIMPETWQGYGGSGNPEDASPAEQSAIAAQIWQDSGSAAWECAG
ncbi:hypothetical protein HJD18_07110 [Thermoleophilia bacterium SCSIO 60948]|nr:hypothetical protein HJD18_07110 [Thermoleophilia bacterium SCSIO 60948]